MKHHRGIRPFDPPFYLKHPQAQTILARSRLRLLGPDPMRMAARPMILHVDGGVRLAGAFSPVPATRKARALVVLIHGWEGSIDSTYIVRAGRHLYRNGFSIFRLNLRDHGPTHHLNRLPFFATQLEEVFDAVRQVAAMVPSLPVFLVGFSLGGNYVLRIARRAAVRPIPNLVHGVAVSPVLEPEAASRAIDASRVLNFYFIRKWRRSLKKKAALFPDLYDHSDVLESASVTEMTEILVPRYGNYKNASDYFRGYAFTGRAFEAVAVPLTVVTAADDPIIPVADFYDVAPNPLVDVVIHRHGGHNGFIDGFFSSWYEPELLSIFTPKALNP